MTQHDSHLMRSSWRVIDQSHLGATFDALDSFALDDTLCATVGTGVSPAVARLWVHHDTVVLGIQDSRLPQAAAGIDYLQNQGYRVIVRNSGGLAVPLDEGVLNISLVLPVDNVFSKIDLGYETMFTVVKEMLQPYTTRVEAREIEGSYCPGRYDLSINGRKFAGISQRRTKGGMAVQVFLIVSGEGRARANLIKQFYRIAAPEGTAKIPPPVVREETLASLTELLSVNLSINMLKQRLLTVLQRQAEQVVITGLTTDEESLLTHNRKRMIERNHKSLGMVTVL